jgi:pimeloyl-ACP methyl ester carboxylesterase
VQSELEKHFIVVNWDQRGAGKSFSKKIRKSSMNVEQLVLDAHELIRILLERFGQKKLFLVGHSWGSVIGMILAKRHPELIHAYIGIGQIPHLEECDRVAYQMLLIYARQNEKWFAVRQLNRIGYPPYRHPNHWFIQQKWLTKFGGFKRKKEPLSLRFRPLFSPEYTLADWIRHQLGMRFGNRYLRPDLMKVNLFEQAAEVEVPVYFCVGRYDFTSPFEIQERYFEQLKAPAKELVWFENSAHFPHLEEPSSFFVTCLRVKEDTLIPKRHSLLSLNGTFH